MLNDIRNELLKILLQKKNYVAMAGHLILTVLVVVGLARPDDIYHLGDIDKTGLRAEDFQSFIDGQFFARCMILPTFVIILPILICTVAGDLIAGEIQDGSLRLYASRTRGRNRIIFTKFIAMFLFSFAYCIYFGIINLLAGYFFFGWQETQVIPLINMGIGTNLVIMPSLQALARYCVIVIYYSLSITILGSLTLFFSTMYNSMTSASITGITLYFVSYILEILPMLGSVKPYLLSRQMNGCTMLWLDPVPIWNFTSNLSYVALYVSVFVTLAIMSFKIKDI